MGRRKAPTIKENALAGQVRSSGGISRAVPRIGSMIPNPLMKYSCRVSDQASLEYEEVLTAINIDARREKQKPISFQVVLKMLGLCLPNHSISVWVG